MEETIALWEELIIQVLFGNKMRIIVPIKQVLDMSKVKFDTEKGRTDRVTPDLGAIDQVVSLTLPSDTLRQAG